MQTRFAVLMVVFGGLALGACGGGSSLATSNNNDNSNSDRDCGNGVLELGETCDGSELGGYDCLGLGYDSGTLGCTEACTFDTSGCVNVTECGDGVAQGSEECDASDLQGATCVSLGWTGGMLACDGACHYDVAACEGTGPECGNDVQDLGEDCDGADLAGETCISQGFAEGTLACDGLCAFDTSGCYTTYCGNDTIEPPEDCDGVDLGGMDCVDLGFSGGTLGCTPNCFFYTVNCTGTPACTAAGGAVVCGGSATGDTSNPPAAADITDWTGAGCSNYGYTGPEILYLINTGGASEGVTVDLTGLTADLDLQVMQSAGLGCDPALPCVGYSVAGGNSDESVTFVSAPNTDYYVVIDGYEGAVSPYSLAVSCTQPTRMIYEWFPLNTNDHWDLEGTTLTFSPNATVVLGYTWSVATGVTDFPTPMVAMTPPLAFAGSDDTTEVTFPATRSFTFFDITYTSMWVNTNGNITFGGGDTEPEESAALFASGLPRIAGEWDNINPVAAGPSTVVVQSFNDRIVVTWNYAPDNFAGEGDHAIQIELFWAGQIAITNLTNGGDDGLCGISEGGGSQSLGETNFVP